MHDFCTCFLDAMIFQSMVLDAMVFWSMVLDASTCTNMYYNIERNIMKNQAGTLDFGIQGKIVLEPKAITETRN